MRTTIITLTAAAALLAAGCSSSIDAEELCQQMKDSSVTGNDAEADWTEEQYLELRDKYERVDDEELSASGTKLVDAVWQVTQLKDGEEMGALAYMGQITDSLSGVQGACARHGVVLSVTGGANGG